MNIYVMRHGRTDLNAENKFNGQIDEDLNSDGIEGAKEAAEIISGLKLDVVFCSPLTRAKHTCDIVHVNNIPVIYEARIKERTLGVLDGKDLAKEGFSKADYYNYYLESDLPGFEPMKEFYKRVHSFMDEIVHSNYENILVIAHGGVLRSIYYYFNGIPEDGDVSAYESRKNCEIIKYEV